MSGGVDSSVAAALLKREGFNVTGMFIKCWDASDPLGESCTSTDDERMARLVAVKLGIPFYALNLVKEYKERVVEYMLEGYKRGVTPNPDVMCNKEIKFGLFFEKAMELGADYVATGHYARLQYKTYNSQLTTQILEAKDKEKDQSYFLSFIKSEVLDRVLFPIGDYTKSEVRQLARKFGLPNAERKSSQGICFIGKVDFDEFLKQYIPVQEGDIVDVTDRVLGKHEGAWYYTIGQRKGIKLSGGPYFVVAKDVQNNRLIVSKDEKDLGRKEAHMQNINWFSNFESALPLAVRTRMRYRQKLAPAVLEKNEAGEYVLTFQEPQRAVTPGQLAVMYQGEQMLAAGVIQ